MKEHGNRMGSEARRTVAGNFKSPSRLEFLGKVPILIDGSNVVRQNEHYGWRVLKTLLDWLNSTEVEWFLYFDANILHIKNLDDGGKAFVKFQIADYSILYYARVV